MGKLKVAPSWGFSWALVLFIQGSISVSVPSPEPVPSLEIFFPPRQSESNNSSGNGTVVPSISERIHASLNNVLRLPLPLLGSVVVPIVGATPTLSQQQQQTGGNLTPEQQQELQNKQLEHGRYPGEAQGAPPSYFLPDVNQAIHSTIYQLSTLSHWPFGYVTTSRPQQQAAVTMTTQQSRTTPASTANASPPPTTTTPVTTAKTMPPTPATKIPVTNAQTPTTPLTPGFVLPATVLQPVPDSSQVAPAPGSPPSIVDRIHNRIHNTINNYVRIPNLSQIGQNRPRPMITEPPWVTELLGPTLEPPTTRAPTIVERIQNSAQNVFLFVPATLLNIWYENFGTREVNRIIQRIQAGNPRPGAPVQPVFATYSPTAPNPFSNFTTTNSTGSFGKLPSDLPAIAAFISSNGTLQPTIVHPVVNMTSNTIEYQLRGQNETTVLWTGSLSNDIFFGNKTTLSGFEHLDLIEDDEEEQLVKDRIAVKDIALFVKS